MSDLLTAAVDHVCDHETRAWEIARDLGLCWKCLEWAWLMHMHRDGRFPLRSAFHPWVMLKVFVWRRALFVIYEGTGYGPAWSLRKDLSLWLGVADLYVHRDSKPVFNYAR